MPGERRNFLFTKGRLSDFFAVSVSVLPMVLVDVIKLEIVDYFYFHISFSLCVTEAIKKIWQVCFICSLYTRETKGAKGLLEYEVTVVTR